MSIRIGHGYDVHQLREGRPMILGGVTIPSTVGPFGHSDADVLTHAVCDALLGALALGDIGQHFPDTDPKYKDANSMTLLAAVVQLIQPWKMVNLDATIILERPKLAQHMEAIRQSLATVLGVSLNAVSVKATTSEKMGFVGEERGVAATAVVLLEQ